MERRFVSLSNKLLLAFILVLLPILVAFLYTYGVIKRGVREHVQKDVKVTAEATEGYTLMFLESIRNRVEDFSTDGHVRGLLASLDEGPGGPAVSRELSRYLGDNKLPLSTSIKHICVLDSRGTVVAATTPEMEGEDFSDRGCFLGGRNAPNLTESFGGHEPELAISYPVRSTDGTGNVGVISAFLPLAEFNEVLSGKHLRELGATTADIRKTFDTLEVYLVSSDMLMLTSSMFRENVVLRQKVDTPPVKSCLESGTEMTGIYPDYRGVEVVGASMCLKDLGWVLLAEVDRAEVLAPVRKVESYFFATAFVVLGFIGILFLFIRRTTTDQLRTMSKAAERIAGGDYDVKIPVRSSDEIGFLSETFNTMTRRVRDRTEDLRKSEHLMEAILNNTTNMVFIKDVEGRFIYANDPFAEVSGVERSEIIGKTDYDILPPDQADAVRENDARALDSALPVQFEEVIGEGRDERSYLSTKFRIPDSPWLLCCVATEITGMKRAEKAVRESEARLANAQRIARLGNWEWDIATNDLYWSDEIYRIFDLEKENFGASYDAFLATVHPDDREYVENEVAAAVAGERDYSIDHRIVLPDGAERVVHEEGEVDFDPEGRPVKMSGTVHDITERVRAEDEVRRLNAELEERVRVRTAQLEAANRELEAFSYSVAHDLRSPLRIIDGFSHAVLEDYGEVIGEEGHDYIRRVREASSRMGDLIDDLLKLSQLMRAEIRRKNLDLTRVARDVAGELAESEPERDVDFRIEEGLAVEADERLMRVVLSNLIGNAWKFTSGQDRAVIEFSSDGTDENGRTIYFVRDNGAGFDMKYADRLFGAFQRLHSSRQFKGTGIGLATVQRIIHRHGGRVWAEGEVDRGATFYFTL